MNTQLTALLLLFTCCWSPLAAHAQGSLTPPGAPAPGMKSLDQIEPRTPIAAVPFTITQPGSYYLTTNLVCTASNAIVIAANSVTLDLGGWTLASTVPNPINGGTAILIGSGLQNITIANGFIQGGVTNNGSGVYSGPGFAYGIYYSGSTPSNVRISGVSAAGLLYYGIDPGYGATVESCTVHTAATYGIVAATVKASTVLDCGYTAISCYQASDCRGYAGGSGYGISATIAQNCYGYDAGSGVGLTSTIARDCYGYSLTGTALSATTAQNCYGNSGGSGYGVDVTGTATGCYGYSYSGVGLYAFIANACHGASGTGTGLVADHNVSSY